jgi:hypothetical protein
MERTEAERALIDEIAEIDDLHANGELTDDEWRTAREERKSELVELLRELRAI